jgi:hypothetical protein
MPRVTQFEAVSGNLYRLCPFELVLLVNGRLNIAQMDAEVIKERKAHKTAG